MRTARSTIFRIERSMKRAVIPLLALFAAGPPAQIRGEELRQVTAVRCWARSGATRVAIEVDGEFEFRAERAHNPERIFFDVERSRPRINGHRFYSANVADKLVKKVRVAETQTGVTRVVLDLQSNADYVPRVSVRTLLPAALLLIVTGGSMAYYFWRVTGKPWRMPYVEHERQYAIAPVFIFLPLNPVPAYRSEEHTSELQ